MQISLASLAYDASAFSNSAGSEIGGLQLKPLQITATVCPFLIAGKFGIVSANAGGSICGTASPSCKCRTDWFNDKCLSAATSRCSALAPLPTTTTCVCGCRYIPSAIPYVEANKP